MSYDLHVYGALDVGLTHLRELAADASLAVEVDSSGGVTLVRGARRKRSFSMEPVIAVEREDVPPEVVAVALDPSFLYTILVEGHSPTEIPHAVRFARRLARATAGAVQDPQTDTVWSDGRLRTVPRPESGSVAVVGLTWYVPVADAVRGVDAWLSSAARWLPEALPRRFGAVEPLSGRLDRDGPDALDAFVRHTSGGVYFDGSRPCAGGSFEGGKHLEDDVARYTLTVFADVFQEEAWRRSVRGFFFDFARRAGAFAASAEVIRDYEWTGRTLLANARTENSAPLARGGKWAGLSPYPVSWAWIGREYAARSGLNPASEGLSVLPEGYAMILSDVPAVRSELSDAAWVPVKFRAVDVTVSDPRAWPRMILEPAEAMPAELRPDRVERSILSLAMADDGDEPRPFDSSGYGGAQLPFGSAFRTLTPAKARDTFSALMAMRHERVDLLKELAERNRFRVDTPELLVRSVDAMLATYPTIVDGGVDPLWESIALDAGLLIGDLATEQHPGLEWRVSAMGRSWDQHHSPAIVGFPDSSDAEMYPLQWTQSLAYRTADGRPWAGGLSIRWPLLVAEHF